MVITRRQLIKTGFFGGAALAAAGYLSKGTFWGAGSRPARQGDFDYGFLTVRDRQTLAAIIPALLSGPMSRSDPEFPQQLERTLRGFDRGVTSLQAAVQAELRELMALLTLAPTRILVARIVPTWSRARPDSVDAFLNRWRNSGFALLQNAYDALQQLTMAAWYGNPQSWKNIGYPGPPPMANQNG